MYGRYQGKGNFSVGREVSRSSPGRVMSRRVIQKDHLNSGREWCFGNFHILSIPLEILLKLRLSLPRSKVRAKRLQC